MAQTTQKAAVPMTMLELVYRLTRGNRSPERVEAIARRLINTGRVRLVGTFCDRGRKAV